MAKFTVDGVEYTINGGINGSLSNPTTGGATNTKCLKKDTAGGDTFTLTRTDGKTFQFYGLWTKHNSMNSYASLGVSLPPFYTITATDDCETRASYTDNTAMQGGSYTTSSYNWAISGGVTVKSVQISFKATLNWWIDDIILGTALNNFTPNLTTGNATNITSTSATLSGSITNSDNSGDWGIVWSKVNTIPEYGQTNTTSVSATTTGNFSNNITFTGVAAGTTIYYRSFSDNWMCGIVEYGDVKSFILTSSFCYKPAKTTGTSIDTNLGITTLGRAGAEKGNWPMVRKGGWLALESKSKGFVINRLSDTALASIPSDQLIEGMIVYNTTKDCLQINMDGTSTGWKCIATQTCP